MTVRAKVFSALAAASILISAASVKISSLIARADLSPAPERNLILPGGDNAGGGRITGAKRGVRAAFAVLGLLGCAAAYFASPKISRRLMKTADENVKLRRMREYSALDLHARCDSIANLNEAMRTPVSAIMELSEMSLASGRITGEDYENLEKIYSSCVTLSDFIKEAAAISGAEHRSFDLVSEEYLTPDLVSGAAAPNAILLGDKGVKFVLDIDESFPLRLKGDELKLRQVFSGILSNAFKHTHKGLVEWKLSCEPDPGGVNAHLVSVVLVTERHLTREEADAVMSDSVPEGPMHGFSAIKHIVKLMGGDISAESERGKGSVFTVRVPQAKSGGETIGRRTAECLRSLRFAGSKRRCASRTVRESIPYASVLVVDDSESDLEITKKLLKPYGMRVDCVDSGNAAVELIMAEDVRYDAILLDREMPLMDGVETARLIRGIGTEYADSVPIIALSSEGTPSEDMFLKNGFQAVLTKPIGITRLNEAVNLCIRDRQKDPCAQEQQMPREESPLAGKTRAGFAV
ncbi:MAG: response regulator [Synergistaceae bacterium]|jgi:signal transduction histidine kinase/FixJ family two-component response regulator|nr:response regulator [Synergistaceae bacterium]